MIKCTECGRDISDQASTCPACGIQLKEIAVETTKPVTIELTSKKWKVIKLFAWPAVILGFLWYISGMQQPVPPTSSGVGAMFLFFGIIGLIVAKLGAWWTNK